MAKIQGLNPFEFRAGIYLYRSSRVVYDKSVLIPLNSGLVFTSYGVGQSTALARLNPFEFRAGIYLVTSG